MHSNHNDYEIMLKNIKNSDPSVDFQIFRLAFTKTEYYKPYDFTLKELRENMWVALDSGRILDALNGAEAILGKCIVDIEAHCVCELCYLALGDTIKMEYHRYMRDGLLKSILDSGDGASLNTAYLVISTSEEHVLIELLDYEPEMQVLIDGEDGRRYDLLKVRDPQTNERFDFYFDISIPFRWINDNMRSIVLQ